VAAREAGVKRREPGSPLAFAGRRALAVSMIGLGLGCATATPLPRIDYEIITTFPHDTGAYTQGLLFHDAYLFESTGRYGSSSLRKVHVETGRVVAETAVDSALFAEGLARVGSELFQLTWKEGVAVVYDLETLERKREYSYEGEGWGLCYDGDALFMSNGSSTLLRRDPESFDVLEEISVEGGGRAISALNELECVDQHVFANVYQTDRIVRIDKVSGQVTGEIDGGQLSLMGGSPGGVDAVLNGIAFIPETGVFLLTGKLWSKVLAVRLTG
jgi:glutamine cyclotransferase